MELGLTGRTAFVAAGSKGLGRAIAEELAREGAELAICARSPGPLGETAEQIRRETGREVLAIPGDVADPAAVEAMIGSTLGRFGKIDILVTNAGGPPSGTFASLTPAMWQSAVDLTLMSVVNLCRLVIPGMKERGWGRIINVTSIAVKQPVEGLMLSNSLRTAVTGFARTLANEVAELGITVNNILPGYTRTERVEQLSEAAAGREGITREQVLAKWESQIPMGRLGEPREFAAVAAFLASSRASYITGQSITVDGGWTKSLF